MAKLIVTPTQAAQWLLETGFEGFQVIRMGQILAAESGLDAYAVNVVDSPGPAFRSLDVGLGQVNTYWGSPYTAEVWVEDIVTELLDPEANLAVCRRIFLARGGARDPLAGYNAWNVWRNVRPDGTRAVDQFYRQAVDAARAVGAWK